jgi:hypothetical protein
MTTCLDDFLYIGHKLFACQSKGIVLFMRKRADNFFFHANGKSAEKH